MQNPHTVTNYEVVWEFQSAAPGKTQSAHPVCTLQKWNNIRLSAYGIICHKVQRIK